MYKLLVSGKRGVGKSFFVKAIANKYNCEGIITKKTKQGVIFGYMQNYKIINYKFCALYKKNIMIPKINIFETFGIEILDRLFFSDKLIIIDEIGFLELDAKSYCDKLLNLLKKKKKNYGNFP